MKFGSVCSGIEAASVAWEPLGWKAAWFSEIEPFPSAVLKHHYPDTPNLGDMTALPDRIKSGEVQAPDLFCGGTPCQAFSVAGLRKSLDDARGNLSLTFCEIANAIDNVRRARGEPAAIVFWENVPGVLNTKDNAFGCFLAGLAGEELPLLPPGGKWTNAGCVFGPEIAVAWRILDAQYFGVAQRRRRVCVVASARDDFDPAAVLFEFGGVRRDSAPSREAGKESAARTGFSVTGSVTGGYGPRLGTDESCQGSVIPQPFPVANCLTARMHKGINSTLDEGQTPVVQPVGFDSYNHAVTGDVSKTLDVGQDYHHVPNLLHAMQVRRLTPVECERLQGFPDNYTAIPWRKKPITECPDGPRYKSLGNSWAVPVVRWIGNRIKTEIECKPKK